jgi:curli biogenesis system outer membrane secretion channel CsgG
MQMLRYTTKSVIFIMLIMLINGCSTKVEVKSLRAPVVQSADIKNIVVPKMKQDNLRLTESLRNKMANLEIENKKFFNIIDRDNIDLILKEQLLQDSGLVNISNKNRLEGLSQADSILIGEIIQKSVDYSFNYETRTNYDKCIEYLHYKDGKKAAKHIINIK